MSQNTREGAKTGKQRPKQGLVDTNEWTPSRYSLADNGRSAVPLTGASLNWRFSKDCTGLFKATRVVSIKERNTYSSINHKEVNEDP